MFAMLLKEYGPQARFEAANIPRPTPGPGEVLVEVRATSFNPVDYKIRTLGPEFAPELPAVLHGDVAGVVAEVGPDVTAFEQGDNVYGCAGGVRGTCGALAGYMCCDADLLALMPTNLDFAEAASLPLVSLTAWQGLFDMAELRRDQTVLVHGGAGGVGHVAVQLASIAGARVAATVSDVDKAETARSLGACDVILYRDEPVEEYVRRLTGGLGFDVVFDTVGGTNLEASLAAARQYGRVATTVARGEHDLSTAHARGLSLHCVFMLLPLLSGHDRKHFGEVLRRVAEYADIGRLRPLVDPVRFTMAEANEAHTYWEAGKSQGKIVLTRC